jgi:DNA-binding GntR family transcriptional regulator
MPGPLDIAYEYIRTRILDGTFRPSQKITENQLSEEIGVSRNTVIKALLKLEQENLVTIEKNKGASVKSFTLQEVINYIEIREALEGLAIRSSVHNLKDEDIERLGGILKEMDECVRNGKLDGYSNLNKAFHEIIYSASGNKQAVEMIKMIKTQLNRFHFKTILVPGRNQESYAEHARIYQALSQRNEDEAEAAIRKHVSNLRRTIEQNYDYLI